MTGHEQRESSEQSRVRTYGNWRRPLSAGLGPLTVAGTTTLLGGFSAAVVAAVFARALAVAAVIAAVTVAGVAVTSIRLSGRPIVVRGAGWVTHQRSRSRRHHLYAAGLVAPVGAGQHRLPGIAAQTELWDCVDAYDQPFALIHARATHDFSVAVRCSPTGAELVDAAVVDRQVAGFGEFLTRLGLEEDLVACAITVQTAPDPGIALADLLAAQRTVNPPGFADEVMDEIAATYPAAAAVVDTVVQLTWRGTSDGRRRTVVDMAADIGAALPEIIRGLAGTGAGTRSRAMTSAGVAAFVRRAYDPEQAPTIAELGDTAAAISWSDAGPTAHVNAWGSYTHDSGTSVVWSMTEPPRGTVLSNVLETLLVPHGRIAVKRVTLLYRPFDPKESADTIDHDVQSADFKVGQQNRVTARDRADLAAAQQSAEEEAAGAGLVGFGMLVSATVTDPALLARARQTVERRLAGPARIELRPCYGFQAAAFAATLPTGIVLPRHTLIGRQHTRSAR